MLVSRWTGVDATPVGPTSIPFYSSSNEPPFACSRSRMGTRNECEKSVEN